MGVKKRSGWADDADSGEVPTGRPRLSTPWRIVVRNLPPVELAPAANIQQFINGALLQVVHGSIPTAEEGFLDFPVVSCPRFDTNLREIELEVLNEMVSKAAERISGIVYYGHMLVVENISTGEPVQKGPIIKETPEDYTIKEEDTKPSVKLEELDQKNAAPEFVPNALDMEHSLYVTNFPKDVPKEDLYSLFVTTANGIPLKNWWMVSEPVHDVTRWRGCGFVQFVDPSVNNYVIMQLDNLLWKGRYIRVVSASDYLEYYRDKAVESAAEFMKNPNIPNVYTSSTGIADSTTSISQRVFSNVLAGLKIRNGCRIGRQETRVVQLLNVVFPEDLIPQAEYESWMNEVRTEAEKFGKVVDVFIPRPNIATLECSEGVGKIFVRFEDLIASRKFQYSFNGRKVDNDRIVCAAFFPEEMFDNGVYSIIGQE